MTRRRVIDELPPERMANDPYGWVEATKEARELQKTKPEAWLLAAEHVPEVKIGALRLYKSEPFRTSEGRITVRYRNSKLEDDGVRYADCYIRWIPKQENQ